MQQHTTSASSHPDQPAGDKTRPLVTFALCAYNQEKFIEEAVAGALAQTYSPLEIILSDDCSTDRTFELMRQSVDAHSRHDQVRLIRADRNQGIGAHVNATMRVATGRLIVVAAGDDVSLPNRVQHLVDVWCAAGCPSGSIYSSATAMDEDGVSSGSIGHAPLESDPGRMILSYMDGVQGSTHAWTPDVFDVFGPLLPDTVCEDRVIALRSFLLGKIIYCPEPLVRYRIHGGSISHHKYASSADVLRRTLSIHKRNLNIVDNYLRDLAFALHDRRFGDVLWLEAARRAARRMRRETCAKVSFHSGTAYAKICVILRSALVNPAQAAKFLMQLCLPSLYKRNQLKNLGVEN